MAAEIWRVIKMAMVKCKECKKEISKSAKKCPNCGVDYPGILPLEHLGGFIVTLAVFGFIFWQLGGVEDIKKLLDYKPGDKPISSARSSSYAVPKSTTKSYNVSVENLELRKDHTNAWSIKGMLRNNELNSIKGHVKIKFLNSKGDVLRSALAPVNGNDSLSPGQAGVFKYTTRPVEFENVTNYDVIFVGR